jgi:hypothetical protein
MSGLSREEAVGARLEQILLSRARHIDYGIIKARITPIRRQSAQVLIIGSGC